MKEHTLALQRAQMPTGTHTVLERRTLTQSNKNLLPLLKAGMTVLDVGCGSGSITCGMAEKVGNLGFVIGIDPSAELISIAKEKYSAISNLSFQVADIFEFEKGRRFDVISTARTLQWLDKPLAAIIKMKKLLKKNGIITVLDYNHEKIKWQPAPQQSMLRFYEAFLQWREAAGMDNQIADHLESIFSEAGLKAIQITDETEFSNNSDADFHQAAGIWKTVAETRGHQLVSDGYITEEDRLTTIKEYNHWLTADAISMKMYLRSATGHNE